MLYSDYVFCLNATVSLTKKETDDLARQFKNYSKSAATSCTPLRRGLTPPLEVGVGEGTSQSVNNNGT